MRISTLDPMSLNDVKDVEAAPYVIEGEGDNAIQLYFESELKLERGSQLVAQKEYELLGEAVSDTEKALMLRQPQLENLGAGLEAAERFRARAPARACPCQTCTRPWCYQGGQSCGPSDDRC